MAVDHGERRIGLAVSDETGTIANPLTVITHTARLMDAAQVAGLAQEKQVGLIVVGQSFGEDGKPNLSGRRAGRFAEALQSQTDTPVMLWDESFSTRVARRARIAMGGARRRRAGHQDDLAAAVILQTYLDAHPSGC
ncbi:MAG: Holliday junction resolvase RuvX [Anaerolineales bacterium]|nr:Holliday junction resolvase RuvX [Anaerolineales bacterium]